MAKHTPGPWQAVPDPCESQEYKVLVVLPSPTGRGPTWIARAEHSWDEDYYGERRISWAEANANARLIAAAPELLEALQQFVNGVATGKIDTVADETLANVTARARAAIAKAKGSSADD